MRTEDLIHALVADLTAAKLRFRQIFALAIAFGAMIATAAFLTVLGVRPDIIDASHTLRFLFKFVFTATLALASIGLLSRLARPGVPSGSWTWAWLAAPALLALAVIAELLGTPASSWQPRLVGSNALFCLVMIPFLSLGPLACILFALGQGAPTRPGVAGAVAGLAASGLAATLYASHCPDDSPLFVATWYTIAIGIVTLSGFLIGSRFLRW
jgi:hypothetical protein